MPASAPAAWLRLLAALSIAAALVSCGVVLWHVVAGHRQRMAIMHVVWPLTALWAGPIGLWAYFHLGRAGRRGEAGGAGQGHEARPFWQQVVLGTTHCGAGCTLGDLAAETLTIAVPVAFFGREVFGTWLVALGLAFLLGIAFQYFTIAPMRHLGLGDGLREAVKADTLSLLAWQVGMYGVMALALFVWFDPATLPKTGPTFWFVMQLAMAAGFLTSAPVNVWLLRRGIKSPM
ncbi:MAG: DUF4396 domain-containing protein [Vicinamibacterales bacterium]